MPDFADDVFYDVRSVGRPEYFPNGLPIPGGRLYNNSVVIVSENGMWKPLRRDGSAMNLLGTGTGNVGGQRVAILICHEQPLGCPVPRSAV
jgi:hypothetical protein